MDQKIIETYARFIRNMHDAAQRSAAASTQKEAACRKREAATWNAAASQIHATFQLGDRFGILAPHAQETRKASESSSEYEARIVRNVRQALPVAVMSGTVGCPTYYATQDDLFADAAQDASCWIGPGYYAYDPIADRWHRTGEPK